MTPWTTYSPPGFSLHGILQARILEWIAISFSRGSSQPRHQTQISCIPGRFFAIWATREVLSYILHLCFVLSKQVSKVAQSGPTLCNPMDCGPPGSSVHGILQATILEWVAISFSRGSSRPWDRTQVSHTAGRRFNLWATRDELCYICIYSNISFLALNVCFFQ